MEKKMMTKKTENSIQIKREINENNEWNSNQEYKIEAFIEIRINKYLKEMKKRA